MKKPTYTIIEHEDGFNLRLLNENDELILGSTNYTTFKECEKFLATLKVHMCFQTNFCRTKNAKGKFGFEIRTCWDDLIAISNQYETRNEREEAMLEAFDSNKKAVFIYGKHPIQKPISLMHCA
ncbi:MAG: hypothetical protein KJP21_00130 [Bacteroidia bacterium]|nr:hypothetical protein [Bacteroidia bacterium]NNJ54620.1 hypothetical protein [Bacteroidia bacterium]